MYHMPIMINQIGLQNFSLFTVVTVSTYSDANTRGGWENLRQLCSHETKGLNGIIILFIYFMLFIYSISFMPIQESA